MEKEKGKLRVIQVFDTIEEVTKEIESSLDWLKKDPDKKIVFGEREVLMNFAHNACCLMIQYESNQISKTELDLYLRKKPVQGRFLTNVSPLDFNFVFVSNINNRIYTSWHYFIDDLLSNNVDFSLIEPYFELSIMYSFDSIIDQIQKMVTDFKAAHEDFDKMSTGERLERFWSWNRNDEYMENDFFEKHLDKCKTIYSILNHEHRSNKGGH